MYWTVFTDYEPVAKKDYFCDAYRFWLSNMSENEFSSDDLIIYQLAKSENFKIKKGAKYFKRKGLFDGEWCTFRARQDLNNLCIKYDLYNDY